MTAPASVRFGPYTFYPARLELQKAGYSVKLPQQSALLLAMLLEEPGEVVTREQMRDRIWPKGTHVEFDFGLNTAINRIRRVLDDSARNPRYVETVHRTGYRFIGACEVEVGEDKTQPAPRSEITAAAIPASLDLPKATVKWPWVAAAALLGCGILGGAWWFINGQGWGRQVGGASLRSSILLPGGHFPNAVRITPAGDRIAYWAGGKVYLRRLDRDESLLLEGSGNTELFEYSPDGSRIALFKRDGIYLQDGDTAKQVVKFNHIGEIRSAAWAKNGMIYYSDDEGENSSPAIYRVAASGGQPERVLEAKSKLGRIEFLMVQQIYGDDGSMLLSRALSPKNRSIYFRNAQGIETDLIQPGMGGRLLPTGHLLYYWANSLYAAAWDSGRPAIAGTPYKVLDGVRPQGWRGAAADVSESGTLVYLAQPALEQRQIVVVDENGIQTKVEVPTGEYEQVRVSPDGNRLAVVRKDSGSSWSVWIYDLKSKAWRSCAEVAGPSPRIVWSPDGEWLALGLLEGDSEFMNIHRLKVSDPAQVERLSERSNFGQFPTDWVAKNNAILYEEGVHIATKGDLYQVVPGSAGSPGSSEGKLLMQGEGWDLDAKVSPDAKWLAYASESKSGVHVYIKPYADSGPGMKLTSINGRGPVWSRQGDKLWFHAFGKEGLFEVRVANGRAVGEAVQKYKGIQLFSPDIWTRPHDVTPDGKLYAILPGARETRGKIELISNWFSELKRQGTGQR